MWEPTALGKTSSEPRLALRSSSNNRSRLGAAFPIFSLYVYGDRPAVSYNLHKRETPIDTRAIFGPYVNNQTSYSVAALYAHSTIAYANSPEGFLSWQKAIDENPESGLTIAPSTNESGIVLNMDTTHRLSRFAVLTDAPAKGHLDFFVVPTAARATEVTSITGEVGEPLVKVSNPQPAAAPVIAKAASLDRLTPTITIILDGSTTRSSIDFPPVEGGTLLVRWTPEKAGDTITIKELNAFNEISLSQYDLGLSPDAIAERSPDSSKDGKDARDGKAGPPAVGEFFPQRSPYLPGGLGFPPNIGRRGPVPLSPP